MNIESLREQFDDLGVDATDEVLDRCKYREKNQEISMTDKFSYKIKA
jgi:hypothetical protein